MSIISRVVPRIFVLISAVFLLGQGICSAALQGNINLISNPGFESGVTGWPSSATYWHTVTGTSHSGSTSMLFQNTDPNSYPMIRRSIPVQVDARYHISAWVKTENVTGSDTGAAIALEYYDSSGNYLPGGVYPAGVKGTNGWTQISADTGRIPSNVARLVYILYLRKGCTGTVWFDDTDVEVRYDYYLRPLITSPHYRDTIYPGQARQLTLGVQAAGNPLHPTNTLLIKASLIDPYSRVTSAISYPDPDSSKWRNIVFSLGTSPAGRYRARIQLVDRVSGVSYASHDLFLTVASTIQRQKVYVDSNNRCIVDGKPFFPLGFYCWGDPPTAQAYLNRMAGTPFNCLMNYTVLWYTLDDIQKYLDASNQLGIKAIFSVKDCYDGSQWECSQAGPWSGTFNVLKGMVSTFKTHPAVLAWYLNDELSGGYLPAIADRYDYIRANDLNHPVWQVLYKEEDLNSHAYSTDILGVDNYPVWYQGLYNQSSPHIESFGQASVLTRNAVMAARGVWMVPQCSSIQPDTTSGSRPPTYQEIMCTAYQGLISGARGLIFYNLTELLDYDGETQWSIMQRVGQNLHSIEPIVLGYDVSSSKQTSVSDSRISVLTRSVDGTLYALAVNPYSTSVQATFTSGSASGATRVYIGPPGAATISASLVNGAFTDTIEPLGVRVYKLSN